MLNLFELIYRAPKLSDDARVELRAALIQKGKREGQLRKTRPATGKPGNIGWLALAGVTMPTKVKPFADTFLSIEQRVTLTECEIFARRYKPVINALAALAGEPTTYTNRVHTPLAFLEGIEPALTAHLDR